mgnify:CR=1 FL=1
MVVYGAFAFAGCAYLPCTTITIYNNTQHTAHNKHITHNSELTRGRGKQPRRYDPMLAHRGALARWLAIAHAPRDFFKISPQGEGISKFGLPKASSFRVPWVSALALQVLPCPLPWMLW